MHKLFRWPEGTREIAYDETEHVKMARDFLKRPDYFLNILLDDEA